MKSRLFLLLLSILFISVSCHSLKLNGQSEPGEVKSITEKEINLVAYEDKAILKYGYKDTLGNILIDPIYDYAWNFKENLGAVRIGEKHGFVDQKGKVIIPINYSTVKNYSQGLAIVSEDYVFGVLDKTGSQVIPIQYHHLGSDSNEFFHFRRSPGKSGVLDSRGNVIVPDSFDVVQLSWDSVFVASKGKDLYILDSKGQELQDVQYQNIGRFEQGMLWVQANDKIGYFNEDWELTIAIEYENNRSPVNGNIAVQKGEKWGIVDYWNSTVVPFEFDAMSEFKSGMSVVRKEDGMNIIDGKGELLLESDFDLIESFPNGYYSVGRKDSVVLLDNQLEPIFRQSFLKISVFTDSLFRIQTASGFGVLNHKGKVLIDAIFDEIRFSSKENRIVVKKDGRYGVFNNKCDLITPIDLDGMEYFSNYVVRLSRKSKSGLMRNDSILVPIKYDMIMDGRNGMYVMADTGRYSLINLKDEIILETEYDTISNVGMGYGVRKSGLWGFLNGNDLKESIPCEYEEITSSAYNMIAKKNGKYGLISFENEIIIPFEYSKIKFSLIGLHVYEERKVGLYSLNGKKMLDIIYDKIEKVDWLTIRARKNKNWEEFKRKDL